MSRIGRRIALSFMGVAAAVAGWTAVLAEGDRTPGQDPQARQMSDSPAAVPPEQKLVDAALRSTKPAERIAALDKVRRDYPKSALLGSIDGFMLSAVLQMPDAAEAAGQIFDRLEARLPLAATADDRFSALVGPASQLIGKKVLLDRVGAWLTGATAALDALSEHRARGRYELGRLAMAQGDTATGEAEYRAAAAGQHAPAVAALVGYYVDRGEPGKAETFLLDIVKATPVNAAALTSLANFYKSEPDKAVRVLRDAVGRDPLLPGPLLTLARLETTRGEDAAALDHYMKAASMIFLRGSERDTMRAMYTKAHGSLDGLEPGINALFRALPKPMSPLRYQPTARRSGRVVLVEMFTGSACPPCVAADLAFDALLDRYPDDAIVPLAYHQHIPGPDPMSTTEGDARRQYYGIDGVPTAQIDGAMVTDTTGETFGGGGRDRAGVVFERYAGLIDAALEQTVEAALAVRGTISGDKVTVGVDVTTLPAAAAGLQLQIVLAERDLLFGGENGIRHHSMVVRAIAGISGQGLPLAAAGTTQHVFDLAAVRADITRSLTADIGRRRAGGGGAQEFAAEDRAMTTIDPARLIVAAYVQTKDRRVLQAAWSAVAPAAK